ncbi:hypothetical protein BJP40_02925 [Streptomyces sp. CC53]|uniref:hypothetical protein n=1 Tax=unclassified Streptomyces TaxID=2593676 RepID=UPI0008DE4CCD|nr:MULTISPECIES: hypothetical protein [unclassified Streptomyces]OII63189.1 hypothetical protein BJP40_02925 [Streptomyces sp. CC53]
MLLHEFRPGRLLAGATALAVAALYAADADGALDLPWYAVFPLLSGGLTLAAVAAGIAYRLRLRTLRRSASSASADSTGAPASTSGSQAIR